MKRQVSAGLVALAVVGILGWDHASADALMNNFGLVDPDFTVTFDEIVFPQGTVITNQYSAFGVEFKPTDPGVVYDTQGPLEGIPGIDGHYVGNFFPVNNPFSIVFTTVFAAPRTDAAFGLATNPGNTTFTALLEGVVQESFSAPTSSDGSTFSYFGFVNVMFDEIRILVDSELAFIDNIQMGSPTEPVPTPVPEPSTLLLLSVGAAWALRRRRAGIVMNS